ncbi:MAG: DUF1501 domain-containing protein [Opitutus sp.]
MNNATTPFLPSTRREFFRNTSRGIGLLAFSHFAPSFLVQSTLAATPAPEKHRSILVLVQLAGGNDGLNTVVPFEDADYYRLRPTLGVAKSDVLQLNDQVGLHPSCTQLHQLFHDGQLAVVQNVGYPNPNRSHFRSSEIWETASDTGEFLPTGWLGRFMDNACAGAPAAGEPSAIHVTNDLPQSFVAQHEHATFGLSPDARGGAGRDASRLLEDLITHGTEADGANASFLQHTMMDALVTEKRVQRILANYRPSAAYPQSSFGHSLRGVSALIAAGTSTRVYFVSLGGFDTHGNQARQHGALLKTLSEGLGAFQSDLKAHGLADQVTTMTFSEFGRRPSENESRGTDHGTAAPLFVMGARVRGGLHGTPPSLRLQRNQDMTFSTDFRQVYATLLDQWMECPAASVLGRGRDSMGFML